MRFAPSKEKKSVKETLVREVNTYVQAKKRKAAKDFAYKLATPSNSPDPLLKASYKNHYLFEPQLAIAEIGIAPIDRPQDFINFLFQHYKSGFEFIILEAWGKNNIKRLKDIGGLINDGRLNLYNKYLEKKNPYYPPHESPFELNFFCKTDLFPTEKLY